MLRGINEPTSRESNLSRKIVIPSFSIEFANNLFHQSQRRRSRIDTCCIIPAVELQVRTYCNIRRNMSDKV